MGANFALVGCAKNAPIGAGSAHGPPRIVSLAPSLTEIAYAIGCGAQLVGDTRYDDYPPAATKLPHVADLVQVDLERVAALAPTSVIALHDEEREGSEITARLRIPVVYLPNRNLDDLYADIDGVGRACGLETAATDLDAELRAKIAAIVLRAKASTPRPRVLYLLGLPGFTVGKSSYLNDLIELAGGDNVAAHIDQPYPNLGAEAILAMNPDVLIVGHDVPFGPDVRAREPWRSINAVRNGRIATPPNDDIIERPGPRVVQGLAWLASALHTR